MFDQHLRVATDHQARLRDEAQRRQVDSEPTRRRFAAVQAIVRLAFPGMDVASGSVLPATH
jgi:hypothetical protein